MLGRIFRFLHRLSINSGVRDQDHVFQRMQAENWFSRIWFKGFLGETRGEFPDWSNGKPDLKRGILQDKLKNQKQELPVLDDDLLTLTVESVEEALVDN